MQDLATDIFHKSTKQSLHLFSCEKEQTEVGNSFLKLIAIIFQDTETNNRIKIMFWVFSVRRRYYLNKIKSEP